jgi:hypothetical protein
VQRLNDLHADDLLAIARTFGGHPDATSARAERVDDDGMDLALDEPGGPATARVAFVRAVGQRGPRRAFLDLSRRAQAALGADDDPSGPS